MVGGAEVLAHSHEASELSEGNLTVGKRGRAALWVPGAVFRPLPLVLGQAWNPAR